MSMRCSAESMKFRMLLLVAGLSLALPAALEWTDAAVATRRLPRQQTSTPVRLARIPNARPRNVIFILTHDPRYHALGFFKGQPFVRTPHLDAPAPRGGHVPHAFVTTSLCSPSRASILTGLYAHRHRVVDNNNPVPPGTVFFSQYLKQAGYETAFIGKWHMGGERDNPQPGFDHWVSFKGQG